MSHIPVTQSNNIINVFLTSFINQVENIFFVVLKNLMREGATKACAWAFACILSCVLAL
jgi:hypothetical protein